nr:hypothetical protein [Corynebacterium appendicis]
MGLRHHGARQPARRRALAWRGHRNRRPRRRRLRLPAGLSAGQRRGLAVFGPAATPAARPRAHLSPDAADSLLDTLLRGPLPGPEPWRTVGVGAHDEG